VFDFVVCVASDVLWQAFRAGLAIPLLERRRRNLAFNEELREFPDAALGS
jgi:hypothetical protein